MLAVVLRPHIERDGCRLDRFDAYLEDELICTSRSGWHEPARRLLELGYPAGTLLLVQHESRPFDPTIRPQTIGELAKWTVKERDRGGLHQERFQSWAETFPVASRMCEARSSGTPMPARAA